MMDREYEIKTIDVKSENFELYQSEPIYYKINKGDCFEISENQLIDCMILPYIKFIKKKFYYKNKIFRFLHLPKWKLFGFWVNIYEWLG